jgi:uncharacterized protein GlcG (DUF336 family)
MTPDEPRNRTGDRNPLDLEIPMTRPIRLAPILAVATSWALLAGDPSPAQTAPRLDLALAKQLMATGESVATRLGAPGGAIAIVDDGGHLVLLERLDDTFPAAATVSTEKARTAALFLLPTENLESAIRNGRHALLGVDLMTPLQGGVPIRIGGRIVGAVGVSGAASADQDRQIADAIAGSLEEASR